MLCIVSWNIISLVEHLIDRIVGLPITQHACLRVDSIDMLMLGSDHLTSTEGLEFFETRNIFLPLENQKIIVFGEFGKIATQVLVIFVRASLSVNF